MTYIPKEFNVAELCCACLARPSSDNYVNWQNIYSNPEVGQNWKRIIEEITSSLVKPDVDQPAMICPSCLASVKIALKFKRRFESNIQRLQELLQQSAGKLPVRLNGNYVYNSVRKKRDTGLRSFQCDGCSKTLSIKYAVKMQARTPTGGLILKCKPCAKNRFFKCLQCAKTFSRKNGLNKHILIHTGERPFECNQCPKTFNQKSSLTTHLRTHTGERPYGCLQCSKTFSRKDNLTAHLFTRKHKGEKRPSKK